MELVAQGANTGEFSASRSKQQWTVDLPDSSIINTEVEDKQKFTNLENR